MTSEELHEIIQNAECVPSISSISKILNILERLNGNVIALERKIERMEKSGRRTANIASCLANGIQPD